MTSKQSGFFFRSVALSIDDLRALYENSNAVLGYRPGSAKIYFVQVPSVSALNSLRSR